MAGKKKGGRNPIAAFFGFGIADAAPRRAQKQAAEARQVKPATAEAEQQVPVAAHSFSGRFITFAIVLAIIAISIYGPLSSFLKQQNEISGAQANIAALEAEQQELQAQVSWWEDDNYVKQQARSRLFYVEPGHTPYLVVGLDSTSALADDTSAAAKIAPEESWTTKLWSSLHIASEEPEAETTGAPQETENSAGEISETPAPEPGVG